MLARIFSVATTGYTGKVVEIECDMSSGLPGITIVGLPNKSIDEAKDRVRSAIKNTGLKLPAKRITLNLAPADLPKDGTAYDLAMAMAILAASQQVDGLALGKSLFIGELALGGEVRGVPGVLSYIETAKAQNFEQIFIPDSCQDEASLIDGITIFPIKNLRQIYRHVTGEVKLKQLYSRKLPAVEPEFELDLSHIHGQVQAKRAIEIAAAGHHNILMTGPPGTGKTMLAKSIISILPPPSLEEVIAITKLHSICGENGYAIVNSRPFRSPHHTASNIALIGGGQSPRPGEISLAHHGVLFLDELPEFSRNSIEALRQPLEDRQVTISRIKHSITYPANFMLVATQNPCPCGYLDDEKRECSCSTAEISRYQKKMSGPLLDRIDMVVRVGKVDHNNLLKTDTAETSEAVRARIKLARNFQIKRKVTNATMKNSQIKLHCQLDSEGEKMMNQAANILDLSARGYMRVLKVSRTIADLDQSANILPQHLAEALQFRRLA